MVAIAQHGQPRHLRLVTEFEAEARNALDARRRHDLVLLRRRLAAVAVVVVAMVGLGLALGRASSVRAGGDVVSSGSGWGSGDAAGALPIAQQEYVVQPGDTLWKIARALQPEGDVRPLVYELGKARKGAPLRVGERITLP